MISASKSMYLGLLTKANSIVHESKLVSVGPGENEIAKYGITTPKMDLTSGMLISKIETDSHGKRRKIFYRVINVFPHVIYCYCVENGIKTTFQVKEYFMHQIKRESRKDTPVVPIV